jgi:MHS family alpha-ketoglutarate permease-like MFS transporter
VPSSRLRSILGGSVGNLVEWYDWYAYSAFALYFAPVFFPAGDATAQLLNACGGVRRGVPRCARWAGG